MNPGNDGLKAAFDSLDNPGPDNLYPKYFIEDQVAMLISDGYEVGAKIRSSEAGLYIIRMENAAINRKNVQFIKVSTIERYQLMVLLRMI